MSFVKDYIDKSHLQEEISYHEKESAYHIKKYFDSLQEADYHKKKADSHLKTGAALHNINCEALHAI